MKLPPLVYMSAFILTLPVATESLFALKTISCVSIVSAALSAIVALILISFLALNVNVLVWVW